jgi:phosphatidate cytidylyltransferase
MHKTRLITAVVMLPILYLVIKILPLYIFALFMALIAIAAFFEFLAMYKVNPILCYIFSIAGVIPIILTYYNINLGIEIITLLFMLVTIVRLFIKKETTNALADVSPLLIGFFYVPVLLTYFLKLRMINPDWVIFLCLVVWGADSFAYYIGKAYGNARLYKSVSPNKTMAGAYGAFGGAILLSYILNIVLNLTPTAALMIICGSVLSIGGIVGDLVESMFKRDAGIKDSGVIIPGHGGFLDKLDAMLFSAPILYYYIKFFIMG